MTLEILGISVLWIFLFGYVIVASIDFGAGFFNAYSLLIGKNHILTNIIKRYLSPVWEVTNVFLVFFFVGIVGFFPQTAFYYGTILLVPVSISLVLLAIRGSYYAFESYGTRGGHIGYTLTYGVAGLLIPASLSVVFAIAGGGYVDLIDGQPVLNYWTLYTSPFAWSIVVLSIAAVLYISAVFLTWYAHKANDSEATKLMRKYALVWAAPLMISALGIMYEMKSINRELQSYGEFMVDVCDFSCLIYCHSRTHCHAEKVRTCSWAPNCSICRSLLCLWNCSISIPTVSVLNHLR